MNLKADCSPPAEPVRGADPGEAAAAVPSISPAGISEFRRGWLILLVATVAIGAGASLPMYSLSMFVEPLQTEFGWARTAIIQANVYLNAALFLMAPFIGRLLDRFEARRVIVPSILLMTAALLAVSRIGSELWMLHIGYAMIGILASGTTAIGYSRIIAIWFHKNRGLALGITLSGISAAAVIAPVAMEASIRLFGWRTAFLVLALWVVSMAPLVWLLLHEPREWAEFRRAAGSKGRVAVLTGLTRAQALRTRQFWFLAASAVCLAIPISALIAHVMPLLHDRGLPRPEAARMAALIGLGGVFGRIGVGFLVDRFYPPLIAAAVIVAAAFGCLLLTRADTLAIGILLVGICLGSEGDLLAFFTSRYFGLKAFSELFGWQYAAFAIGFTVGPLIASALYDYYGGYNQALALFCAIFLLAGLLQGTLGRKPAGI